MTRYNEVLDYWLGDAALSPTHANEQKKLWYRSSEAIDKEIRDKFADLHQQAAAGELGDWQQEARSCLALVIILDQFSRHLYRGEANAFAYDDKALSIARECPEPESLPWIGQAFLYHPFEHSEQLAAQSESVERFRRLMQSAAPEWQPMMENFYQHAQEHHDIVLKFGRFPHRNSILGRDNTPLEETYLSRGGKTFGQKPKQ